MEDDVKEYRRMLRVAFEEGLIDWDEYFKLYTSATWLDLYENQPYVLEG